MDAERAAKIKGFLPGIKTTKKNKERGFTKNILVKILGTAKNIRPSFWLTNEIRIEQRFMQEVCNSWYIVV